MQHALRPYVTAGIAIVGASLITVAPMPLLPTNVQQRTVQLVDYAEVDYTQLVANTEANWSGLESVLTSSHWLTDPDISQGLSVLFSDLSSGTSNAVTNPASLLTEGALALLNSGDGVNAALTAVKAVSDNVESALSSGNDSTALTDLENGFSTVLNAFLNGYPDAVGSGGLISPELGLLTNTAAGAATGEIDSLAQVSNTVADELSALGGGDLTTGSLPLVTGNLDLSISVSQVLSDLGLGSALTPNGLLTDLGINPTADVLPTLTIGNVLGDLGLSSTSGISLGTILSDLGLSDSTGISLGTILGDLGLSSSSDVTLGQVLSDLGLSDSSGISLSTILGDLGLTSSSGISLGAILSDLGLSDSSSISLPTISVGSILSDLGLSDSSGINLGTVLSDLGLSDTTSVTPPTLTIPVDTILADLGLANSSGDITLGVPSVSLGTILGDLGINTSAGFNVSTLITDLVGDPTVNVGCVFGQCLSISLTTLLNDAGLGGTNVSLGSVLGDLGINTSSSFTPPSLSIPVSTILSDLGIANTNGDITLSVPSLSLGTILSDLGLSNSSAGINIGDILNSLGLSDTSTITPPSINLGDVLSTLGLSDNSSLGVSQILSDLGLSGTSSIDVGSILSALGLSDSSSLGLSQILSDLGLSGTSSIDVGNVLSALGLSDSSSINFGDILSALGLSSSTTIPLPSLSIDNILTDLGINPNSNLLTDLGIPDTLTLSPNLDLTGGPVATYFDDLAKDLLAAAGTSSTLSSALPSLLGTDPTLNLEPLLSSLLSDLNLPGAITGGDLAANLTNIAAELFPSLF